jgi:hypothetical protein
MGQRGRWRVAQVQRDAQRRRLEARHAVALARHRGRLRRARAAVVEFGVGTAGSGVAVAVTSGVTEVLWSVACAVCALETGLSVRRLAQRRGLEPPAPPQLPVPVPAPPPRSSAAWPALHRLDTAVTAIRRLTPALPAHLVEAAGPSVEAARAAYDVGRAQAAQIAATEAALAVVPDADRAGLAAVRTQLLGELDLAAEAVERLLASLTRLIGARSGYDARGQLSAATAEVVARTYGLAAAALTNGHPGP